MVNDLSSMFDIKLRHNAVAHPMHLEPLFPGKELSGKPFPGIVHAFAEIIRLHFLKVLDRGPSKWCY